MKAFLVSVFLVLALAGTVRAQGQVDVLIMTLVEASIGNSSIEIVSTTGIEETIALQRPTPNNFLSNSKVIMNAIAKYRSEGWLLISTVRPYDAITRYIFERPRP